MLDKYFLFEIGLTNETQGKILEYIMESVEKSAEKYYIVTPNPEILAYANKHKDFKNILNNAKIALIDGIGVVWASKFLGKSIKGRVTGVDLMENLCKAIAEKPITVGFLGGGPKIAEMTAECLKKKYSGLKVAFAGQEWESNARSLSHIANDARQPLGEKSKLPSFSLSERRSPENDQNLNIRTGSTFSSFASGQASIVNNLAMKQFDNLTIDILFVAFGFPKQEKWMAENLERLPVKVAMGVGGAFDYISGNVPRAPKLVRNLGFEWLYRLVRQPWRWKRQLVLIEFGWLVLKEKFLSGR